MTRTIIKSLLLALCIICAALYADALPPIFPGYSISPFDAENVRMKSEKIDIYYSDTCRIEAVFEIMNPTREIVEKKIGFPFNVSAFRPRVRSDNDTASKIYDFVMSLNGENQVETDVPSGHEIRSDTHYWYGWTCKFKPDLNIIKLTYHTLKGFGNFGYRWEKTVHYILSSDKNWPGAIDTVRVRVHFPESIAQRQVLAETSPPGYEIKEKEIDWRFTSFTPTPTRDINLHIIDLKVFADMLRYEPLLSAPKTDNATKLKAAEFFASLAPVKGINMSAPTYFKRSYYDETVLPNLKSSERVLFDSTYKFHKGSGHEDYYSVDGFENFNKNNALRHTVMDVANRIGYFEKIQYPVIYKYIVGAKRLFNEVVTSEPKNAEAWKAYIDNYYLIETGACSPCIRYAGGRGGCPESQKDLVRKAFLHCGNDSLIALWHRFIFPTHTPLPDTVELERFAKPQENITIKIKYNYHSWSEKTLSPEELNLVKNAYKMTNDAFFVLKNTSVDEATQKKLAEILGAYDIYRDKFCQEFVKLRKRGK